MLQYLLNGFVNGSAYGVLGLSFGLIVAVTGRFHFAWAISYTLVAFSTAYISQKSGMPAVPAVLLGMAIAVAITLAMERFIYRPVAARAQRNAVVSVFVASVGITIGGAALIRLFDAGSDGLGSQNFVWVSAESHRLGSEVTYTTLDLVSVLALWATAIIVWQLLSRSRLGREVNAVKVNPMMARAVGIRDQRTYLYVFAIGTIAAGVAALFDAMRFSATPDMGLRPVFYAFVVAFLAGIGRSPIVVMIVGVGLGLVEGLSLNWVSSQWQTTVVFAVLLGYVLLRAARTAGLFERRTPTVPPAAAAGTS
jgi:branched-subunit amino acid ABC-type transport system permease component